MATTEEIQRLVLQVQGRDEIERLREALRAEEATLLELATAQERGTVTQQNYARQANATTDAITQHRSRLQQLERSQVDFTRAMQQGAYAVGDFMSTSGGWGQRLNSVANNVQYVGAQFGGWGVAIGLGVQALASGLTLAEKTLGESKKHIDDHLKELQARIKELEEKPVKVAVDIHELEEAKRQAEALGKALAAFKRFSQGHSEEEEKSGAAVADIIKKTPEGPAGMTSKIASTLTKQQFAQIDAQTAKIQNWADATLKRLNDELKDAYARGNEEAAPLILRQMTGVKKTLQDKLEEQAKKRAKVTGDIEETVGRILDKAVSGDQLAIEQLASKIEEAGMKPLAAKVRGQTVAERRVVKARADRAAVDEMSAKQEEDKARERRELEELEKEFGSEMMERFLGFSFKHPQFATKPGETSAQSFRRFAQEQRQRELEGREATEAEPKDRIERQAREMKRERQAREQEERVAGREVVKGFQQDPEVQAQMAREAATKAAFDTAIKQGVDRQIANARAQSLAQGVQGEALQQATEMATVQALRGSGLTAGLNADQANALARQIMNRAIQTVEVNEQPLKRIGVPLRPKPKIKRPALKAPVLPVGKGSKEEDRRKATKKQQTEALQNQIAEDEERENLRQFNLYKSKQFEKATREAAQKRQAEIMGNATKKPGDQASINGLGKAAEAAAVNSNQVDTLLAGTTKMVGALDRLLAKDKARGAMLSQWTNAIDRLTG